MNSQKIKKQLAARKAWVTIRERQPRFRRVGEEYITALFELELLKHRLNNLAGKPSRTRKAWNAGSLKRNYKFPDRVILQPEGFNLTVDTMNC